MGQFFSGLLKTITVLAIVLFIIWGLNQFGIIDFKTLFLQSASFLPGLHDLAQNYDLGKKRSELLGKKEKELQSLAKKLQVAQIKLDKERNDFEEAKNTWQNTHPSIPPKAAVQQNIVHPPIPAKFPLATSDEKLKQYLNMVGTMKPKQAAAVIQKLPEETVFMIFDQLRPNQVTKIMENLPEAYLANLTQDRLNKYRNL